MKRFRELLAILFPYRAFMAEEIAYLKQQLAQERRRNDELVEAIKAIGLQPIQVQRKTQLRVENLPNPKPLGWEAFRAANKESHDHADGDRASSPDPHDPAA